MTTVSQRTQAEMTYSQLSAADNTTQRDRVLLTRLLAVLAILLLLGLVRTLLNPDAFWGQNIAVNGVVLLAAAVSFFINRQGKTSIAAAIVAVALVGTSSIAAYPDITEGEALYLTLTLVAFLFSMVFLPARFTIGLVVFSYAVMIVLAIITNTEGGIWAFIIGLMLFNTAVTALMLIVTQHLRRNMQIEQQHAQEKLQAERNLLRNVIDNMPYYIYVKDRQGRFLLNNRMHLELFGAQTQEEILGKTDNSFFPEGMAQEFNADEAHIIETGEPMLRKHERTLSPQRAPIWGLASKIPLRDTAGNITGLVGSTLDITPEIEAREALQKSQATQRALLEALPDLMFRMSVDGIYLDFKAARGIELYAQPDQFLGRSVLDVVPEHVAREFLVLARRAIETDEVQTHTYTLPFKDGDRMFEARLVGAGATEVISVVRDITDRSRAEQERLEKERLQGALDKEREVAEIKKLFTTALSHELRNPLAAIMSSVDFLTHYGERATTERRDESLQTIRAQATHLVHMLNDILLVMQVQGDELTFSPQPVQVVPFVKSIVDEFQASIGAQHHLALTVEIDPGTLPIDQRLLRYVLYNLLGNAIKYSAADTKIITCIQQENEYLKITVSDQGIGIPEQDQAMIFQAFQRGRNTKGFNGTGLGLKIVRDCLELHHGAISLESAESVGSTFTILLPTAYPVVRDKRRTTTETRAV
jgi:PAS domain S-box-containing protein